MPGLAAKKCPHDNQEPVQATRALPADQQETIVACHDCKAVYRRIDDVDADGSVTYSAYQLLETRQYPFDDLS